MTDAPEKAKSPPVDARALVLVIDDDPTQQRLYSLIQAELGMIPFIVSTCDAAIEASRVVSFDLIILDLHMPRSSGIRCVRKIQESERRRGTKTPIIAVTAHAMAGDREKCMESGIDDYLSKPFALADLREKISIWAA